MLFFLSAHLKINNTIDNPAAMVSAMANSSKFTQNPNPNPVAHNNIPSPIPIFPPVNKLIPTTATPVITPPKRSKRERLSQNGMHSPISKIPARIGQRYIFLHRKS